MKKLVCMLAAVLLLAGLACPAFAAENSFVPSITYKGAPEVDDAVLGSEDAPEQKEAVDVCVVVSSIIDAEEERTDISPKARARLLDVYDRIAEGELTLPLEQEYVILELVDVSFELHDCVDEGHTHEDYLELEDVTATVRFDLGISADTNVHVLIYNESTDSWDSAISTVNNGDGTITCVMEHFGPVAFAVDAAPTVDAVAKTGTFPWWWLLVLLVCCAIVGALIANRRKKTAV